MYESPALIWSTFDLDRVEAEHGDAGLGEGHGEGQADVAETDHADLWARRGSGGGGRDGRRVEGQGTATPADYSSESRTPTERTRPAPGDPARGTAAPRPRRRRGALARPVLRGDHRGRRRAVLGRELAGGRAGPAGRHRPRRRRGRPPDPAGRARPACHGACASGLRAGAAAAARLGARDARRLAGAAHEAVGGGAHRHRRCCCCSSASPTGRASSRACSSGCWPRLGAVDWVESRRWEAAERERETRILRDGQAGRPQPAAGRGAGLRDAAPRRPEGPGPRAQPLRSRDLTAVPFTIGGSGPRPSPPSARR